MCVLSERSSHIELFSDVFDELMQMMSQTLISGLQQNQMSRIYTVCKARIRYLLNAFPLIGFLGESQIRTRTIGCIHISIVQYMIFMLRLHAGALTINQMGHRLVKANIHMKTKCSR